MERLAEGRGVQLKASVPSTMITNRVPSISVRGVVRAHDQCRDILV
jgi:hypothetical protein